MNKIVVVVAGVKKCMKYVAYAVFARMAARLLVTAWKPDLILVTEQRDPHDSH
jgi:hypothetical protein